MTDASTPRIDPALEQAPAPIAEEAELRYIAGLMAGPDGEMRYSVYAVAELGGDREQRVGGPYQIISGMSQKQLDHLHLQLGAVATRAAEAEAATEAEQDGE